MNHSIFRKTSFVMALITAIALPLMAQMHHGRQGRMSQYDPKTEVTVKGTVEEVQERQAGGMRSAGIHLVLKTDSGNYDVHVGPAFFLKDHNYTFAKGDQLEVTGSKIKISGADALIAREIKKGSEIMTLRDAQGIPLWSGGRRRQG